MARGAPKKPAPVSGPGAMSKRTDGGPGSSSQPVRVPTGGDYGSRKELETQQQAAPLAAGGAPAGGGGAPISPPSPNGVFGPTERPNIPLNQGLAPGGQIGRQGLDAQMILELLFNKYQSPYLARMMRNDRGISG
jgi:hypothetical protein